MHMLAANHYSTPPHEEEHNTQKTMEYETLDPTSRILHPPHNNTNTNTTTTSTSFRSQTSPCHYASPSPSNSRRGSLIDIALHQRSSSSSNNSSPPSSPSHQQQQSNNTLNRPSPFEHRPDLISTPASPLHSPWRRDSLPSISQLTSELHFHPSSSSSSSSSSSTTTSPFHPTSTISNNHNNQINHSISTLPRSRHTSSPGNLLFDDPHVRRHSIAIAPSLRRDYPSTSSTPSSSLSINHSYPHPHHQNNNNSGSLSTNSSPHHQPRFDNYPHFSSPSNLNSNNNNNNNNNDNTLAIHPTTTTTTTNNNNNNIASSSTSTSSSSSTATGITSPLHPSTTTRRHSTAHAPYSRSPELRVSHKLAERKRRKEMKDLFDDLREILPVDKGLKTSKWEILSKAVGYINHLHEREENFAKEIEELRKELMFLKQK